MCSVSTPRIGVSSDLVGTVQAFLNVEEGQRYLVDFSINAGMHTSFEISSSGGTQVTSVAKGPHHLLVYLDAQNTETTEVSLSAKNAIYSFYSLEVTRVDCTWVRRAGRIIACCLYSIQNINKLS